MPRVKLDWRLRRSTSTASPAWSRRSAGSAGSIWGRWSRPAGWPTRTSAGSTTIWSAPIRSAASITWALPHGQRPEARRDRRLGPGAWHRQPAYRWKLAVPTAGWANPTLTILALALRTADRMAAGFSPPPGRSSTERVLTVPLGEDMFGASPDLHSLVQRRAVGRAVGQQIIPQQQLSGLRLNRLSISLNLVAPPSSGWFR